MESALSWAGEADAWCVNRQLAVLAAAQGDVFSAQQALSAGFTPRQIERRVHSKQWHRLRRGVYCDARLRAEADHRRKLLLDVAGALLATAPVNAASHFSAGRLYELPFIGAWDGRPWLTAPAALGVTPYVRRDIVIEAAGLPESRVHVVGGLRTTTVARTVVDLARHLTLLEGVVVADAALFLDKVSAAQLAGVLAECERWPGIAKASEVLTLADGRAESPYESVARVLLHRAGIPCEPQVWLYDSAGLIGRVDLYLPESFTVVEVDGDVKYDEFAEPWTLTKEKRRQERLEQAAFGVVRVSPDELEKAPDGFARRVRQVSGRTVSLRAADLVRSPPTGRVGPPPEWFINRQQRRAS